MTAATTGAPWGKDRLAWAGAEILEAVDLRRLKEEERLPAAERLARAARQQAVYLDRLRASTPGTSVAMRWMSDGGGRLRVVMLARVQSSDPADPAPAAAALAGRLAQVPDHLVAEVVSDQQTLTDLLMPFPPISAGLAQIQKRVRLGQPQGRSDAGVASYVGVEPFGKTVEDWTPLLDLFASHPYALVLSVQLTPVPVDEELRRTLAQEATRYAKLSRPDEAAADLGGRIHLLADRGAAVFGPLFDDALHRYTDIAFQFTVLVASPAPLDEQLLQAIGSTLSSPRPPSHSPGSGSGPGPGGFTVRRPHNDGEAKQLTDAFFTLHQVDLGDQAMDQALARDHRGSRQALRRLHALAAQDEAASLFRLPAAIEGRVPGLTISAPQERRGRRLVQPTGPSLDLGRQNGGKGEPVLFPLRDLTRHAFIVGTSGSGKTNTALHLCRQLADADVPFLVIEPVNAELNDYRWLATQPGLHDLLVLTVGNESVAPLRLNPLEVPLGATVATHVSNLLVCFEAAFGLWDPLPFLYRRALLMAYRRRGLFPGFRRTAGFAPRWPMLTEFVSCLGEVVDALGYEGEMGSNIKAASKLRAESLIEGSCASTLDCRESFDLSVLLQRPVIVELAAVGDNAKEQSLITLLILNAVRTHRRGLGAAAAQRPHVMMIEDVHRIFPTGGDQKEGQAQALAIERIAQGLAEDRKYGQAYVLIDQQIGKVSEDAYKITNLKVMHRTPSLEDRNLLGATMPMQGDQLESAARMRPFDALISHDGLDAAVLTTLPDVRRLDAEARGMAEAPLAQDRALRRRHQLLLATSNFAAAMAPFDECDGCTHRCVFRSQAHAVAATLGTPDLREAFDSEDLGLLIDLVVQESGAPQGSDSTRGAEKDYQACVFLHLFRSLYPSVDWEDQDYQNASRWTHLVREELASS